MKFEAAYFRSLQFADPAREQAGRCYERCRNGKAPPSAEYTAFQDYVARFLFREAARLQLAVHFHTAVGVGQYFNLANANVMNLESVLRDPRYGSTTFVLLHGGYPFDRAATWVAARRNVYIDSSLLDLLLYPAELARMLRHWLETYPDKILFGSDAFPFNDALGVEESYWVAVQSARSALTLALAQMVAAREIDDKQALTIARGYLHDNAANLYARLQAVR
jgi:predicted TIM-barrel fold metal-dependent hydrolase